jgi:hypothetical protein
MQGLATAVSTVGVVGQQHHHHTNSPTPQTHHHQQRLVIYSSDTPDQADFVAMVKVHKVRYDFEAADADELVGVIRHQVRLHTDGTGFERYILYVYIYTSISFFLSFSPVSFVISFLPVSFFRSIALACHGPPEQKERVAQAMKDREEEDGHSTFFHWEISKHVRISHPAEFDDRNNPVRRVMFALAEAVVDGGRVDLLACSLLHLDAGRQMFDAIEADTGLCLCLCLFICLFLLLCLCLFICLCLCLRRGFRGVYERDRESGSSRCGLGHGER